LYVAPIPICKGAFAKRDLEGILHHEVKSGVKQVGQLAFDS